MWVILAFISACFLGLYDVAKKTSLRGNAVLPVLAASTAVSALIFLPVILSSVFDLGLFGDSILAIHRGSLQEHLWLILKAIIVLSSWICGFYGLRSTPLTIYGPINATRPVFVLLGAIFIFGERLNLLQWLGVIVSFGSLYLLSVTSKKGEGIDFRHNRGIWCVAAGTILGAVSALYDKFLMQRMDSVFVQSWFSIYNAVLMTAVMLILWLPGELRRRKTGNMPSEFRWRWSIPLISVFITIADFAYMYSLTVPGSMVSIISTIRRGSVIISFLCAALIFHEKNLKAKSIDLAIVLLGMLLLLWGSLA